MIQDIYNYFQQLHQQLKIDNYVYGQDFDDLRLRVERLFGSWLFVDYGDILFTEASTPGSLLCTMRLAVTVADKQPDRADMTERMMSSDRMLHQLNKLYAHLMADAERGTIAWLDRRTVHRAQMEPFAARELQSYGWTLFIDIDAYDALGTTDLKRQILKEKNA